MIDIASDTIFADVGRGMSVWVPSDFAGGDLAAITSSAVEMNANLISVAPASVAMVWPWLEHTDTKILARFYPVATDGGMDAAVSALAAATNSAFRTGATGAQVFLPMGDLADFCRHIRVVRDDLFFNKMLCVGLDISEIGSDKWADVFDNLTAIRADAVVLALTRDAGGKSDFVGRVYGMLNYVSQWGGALHFTLGNNLFRIEQVWRLIQAMRPEIAPKTRFFITP